MKNILAVVLAACSFAVAQTPPAVYNLPTQATPFLDQLESGLPTPLGVVGDSIATNPEWPSALWADYDVDYGGTYGYRSIAASFAWLPDIKIQFQNTAGVVKLNTTGIRNATWGIYTASGGATQLSGLGDVILTVPAGSVYRLHYLTYPGGGTLVCDRTNVGGIDLSISTDGPVGNAVVTLPAGTKYKISAAAGMVQVNGLELLPPPGAGGIVLYPVGRGNNNPHNYNTGNTPSTGNQWQLFNPTLLLIQTDWFSPNQTKQSFITDIKAYIAYIRSNVPNVKIVLIAHHMMSVDNPDVSATIYQIAVDTASGFIDHRQVIDFNAANAAGYIQPDGTHLTVLGGQFFADYDHAVFDFAYRCWIDLDQNGVVDSDDQVIYDSLWAGGNPTADVNSDGIVDQVDLDMFDSAYAAGC